MPDPNLMMSLVLIAALAAAAWFGRKDGRANPVSTKKLEGDVKKLAASVAEKDGTLNARVSRIETAIEDIRRDLDGAPTKADIARLAERIAGVAGHVESTDQAVVRIEQFLMNGGAVAQAVQSRPRRKS